MKSFSIGALIAAAAALGISIFCTFTLDNALSWTDRVNLIFDPASAESFDAYYFAFGTLPRFAAAAIGGAVGSLGSLTAAGGSFVVLLVLLGLSKSSRFSPDVVVLMGIAISAFLDSAVTLALSRGTMENYFILQWLSGSTYRTTPLAAAMLLGAVLVLISIAFAASRSMTLLSISRDFAQSRGLSLTRSALGLLTLCALLCASATAAMGPVAFVGLVAPHMAVMIGARTVKTELCTAALLGAALVSWADWLGQVLIAPAQIPAGTLASIIGAGYFLILLVVSRR